MQMTAMAHSRALAALEAEFSEVFSELTAAERKDVSIVVCGKPRPDLPATDRLLGSPRNAKRLSKAIRSLDAGRVIEGKLPG